MRISIFCRSVCSVERRRESAGEMEALATAVSCTRPPLRITCSVRVTSSFGPMIPTSSLPVSGSTRGIMPDRMAAFLTSCCRNCRMSSTTCDRGWRASMRLVAITAPLSKTTSRGSGCGISSTSTCSPSTALVTDVEGEQVLVELIPQPLPREVVFDKGAVIATSRIDARQPLSHVVDDILQFLQQDVKNAAIRSGMIPRVDPDTGKEEVGIIGPKELVTLTEQVIRKGGLVQLTAVARASISPADSPRLSTEQTDRQNMEIRIAHAHMGK